MAFLNQIKSTVDSVKQKASKLTNNFTEVLGFNTLKPPSETVYKDKLFHGFGSGKPALQHKFALTLSVDIPIPEAGASSPSPASTPPSPFGTPPGNFVDAVKAKALKVSSTSTFLLDTVMAISDPTNEFTFDIDINTGYGIAGIPPKAEKVSVTYWDYDDFPYTSFLINKYYNQISDRTGMLKQGYMNTQIVLYDQLQMTSFTDCAITKPKSFGFDATLGVRKFTFDFVFSDISYDPMDVDQFDAVLSTKRSIF